MLIWASFGLPRIQAEAGVAATIAAAQSSEARSKRPRDSKKPGTGGSIGTDNMDKASSRYSHSG
ncbi:hypothetical protein Cthiooxydans_29840 [Comamonas thiooxydans]|nr:hypothetical protein Cthiooxydans_29840 [Comamonas thiooxydans]